MKKHLLSICLVVNLLPNPSLTPGATSPALTKETICAEGFRTGNYRKVSTSLKKKVFAEYGIDWKDRAGYEVDHLIALTDGGSNDIKNLWPQSYEPKDGAHEKDVLEYWLNRQVCKGKMDLSEAQEILKTDWHRGYLKMKGEKAK